MTSPTSYFAAAWERWDRLANLRADAYAGPRIEPVDPPADVLAAFSALTVKGSPLEAARTLFGGTHA